MVAALCQVAVRADELSLVPRQGVVLLNNGELIAGTIIAAGDRYDIHLEAGEISIKRGEVAMVCRDAAECYRLQRQGLELGRAQDHLKLAQWCIKNELLDEAVTELAAARAADPAHPGIRLVESRLELARAPLPAAANPSAIEKPASRAAPDLVTRNLPGGTVESFTNAIQPMLLNYCAKGGCHAGRGQGGFQLERIHPKLAGRLTTQRNLRRVLAQLDRNDPMRSALLNAPIQPHGSSERPIFTHREQSQYKQLVHWVCAVTGDRQTNSPPTLAERTAPLLQTVPGASGAVPDDSSGVRPTAYGQSADPETAAPPLDDGEPIAASGGEQDFTRTELRAVGMERRATSNVQYGADAASGAFVPKDPFDPEIFNRRFFGR